MTIGLPLLLVMTEGTISLELCSEISLSFLKSLKTWTFSSLSIRELAKQAVSSVSLMPLRWEQVS